MLFDLDDQSYYVSLTGRWYRGRSLEGPWTFVEGDKLPPTSRRSRRPSRSRASSRRCRARRRRRRRSSPTASRRRRRSTARKRRTSRSTTASRSSQDVPDTPLQYAVNSPTPVIRVDPTTYYAVQGGVWFTRRLAVRARGSSRPRCRPSSTRSRSPRRFTTSTYVRVYRYSADDRVGRIHAGLPRNLLLAVGHGRVRHGLVLPAVDRQLLVRRAVDLGLRRRHQLEPVDAAGTRASAGADTVRIYRPWWGPYYGCARRPPAYTAAVSGRPTPYGPGYRAPRYNWNNINVYNRPGIDAARRAPGGGASGAAAGVRPRRAPRPACAPRRGRDPAPGTRPAPGTTAPGTRPAPGATNPSTRPATGVGPTTRPTPGPTTSMPDPTETCTARGRASPEPGRRTTAARGSRCSPRRAPSRASAALDAARPVAAPRRGRRARLPSRSRPRRWIRGTLNQLSRDQQGTRQGNDARVRLRRDRRPRRPGPLAAPRAAPPPSSRRSRARAHGQGLFRPAGRWRPSCCSRRTTRRAAPTSTGSQPTAGDLTPLKAFVGVCLLVGWVFLLRATVRVPGRARHAARRGVLRHADLARSCRGPTSSRRPRRDSPTSFSLGIAAVLVDRLRLVHLAPAHHRAGRRRRTSQS